MSTTPQNIFARTASAALIALGLSACSGSGSGGVTGGSSLSLPPRDASFLKRDSGSGYISHIVVLVQENRSLDDLFATFPGADGATHGKMKPPGGGKVQTVQLAKVPLVEKCDFGHRYQGFKEDYDKGKMDGFGLQGGGKCGGKVGPLPYQYVDPNDIIPYWFIAQNYVLADEMFQTQGSGSFTAHQDLIRGGTTYDAALTKSLVDYPSAMPWGCDAKTGTVTSFLLWTGTKIADKYHAGPFPCTNQFPGYPTYVHDAARSARRRRLVEVLLAAGYRRRFGRPLERLRHDRRRALRARMEHQRQARSRTTSSTTSTTARCPRFRG